MRTGRTLAFGKVGDGEVARRLVTHEAAVLADAALRTLASVDVPRVIDFGQWHGLDVLLLTALGSSQRRASSWDLPVRAMHEVAESTTVTWALARESSYWSDLVARAAPGLPARAAAARGLPAIGDEVAETSLGFGRWHGDWAPWNMGSSGGRLELWDWEQSSTASRCGFDAVHFVLQRLFRDATTPESTGRRCCRRHRPCSTGGMPTRSRSAPRCRCTSSRSSPVMSRRPTVRETAQLTARLEVLFDLAERRCGL